MALHMLREAELLTPAMFASLAVQWLPLVTQRVARKADAHGCGEWIYLAIGLNTVNCFNMDEDGLTNSCMGI